MRENYVESARKQFEYYQALGEKSFAQLNEEALFWKAHEESNSIANIVNHLHGNMLSRWTNFLTEDGEKTWRKRDEEFEDGMHNKAEMLEKWQEGWTCLFEALASINEENFSKKIYIRNQEHSIVDAVNRQLAHYAYHVGQIVFIAKMKAHYQWQSLSIPKGNSANYNQDKFAKGKHTGHFTDDLK